MGLCCTWLLCALVLLAAALTTSKAESPGGMVSPLPDAARSRLPELYFLQSGGSGVVQQALNEANAVVPAGGKRYVGFRFRVPAEFEGAIEFLVVSSAKEPAPQPWLMVSEDGTPLATLQAIPHDGGIPARIASQFPQAGSATYQKIPRYLVQHYQRYYILRALDTNQPAALSVMLTMDSDRARREYGDLNDAAPVSSRRLPADDFMATLLEIRKQQGPEAAIPLLIRELDQRAEDVNGFRDLYQAAHHEADRGGGRMNPYWSSLLFDALFTATRNNRYYSEMINVSYNTMNTLEDTGRYGRLAEVMEMWCEAQRLGGYRMDPTTCPDLGPALAVLPELRLRDIPYMIPFALAEFPDGQPRSKPWRFDVSVASGFERYARHLEQAGHWREALEWYAWVRQWATGDANGFPVPFTTRYTDKVFMWFRSGNNIASTLSGMGFSDAALAIYNKAMEAPYDKSYNGRAQIFNSLARLELLISLNRAPADLVAQLQALVGQAKAHPLITLSEQQQADTQLAKGLIHVGRDAEGFALLDRLVGEGSRLARDARLGCWIDKGRVDQVEDELFCLLKLFREAGNKSGETRLYMIYADFLEKQGRYEEALRIRREAVRLCRSFDYFTKLPGQLASLASLLDHLNDAAGRQAAEQEAQRLLAQGRLPDSLAKAALDTLAKLPARTTPVAINPQPASTVDLQPSRSIVIPVEGLAWTTYLTLLNPSVRVESGTLSASGLPAMLTQQMDKGGVVVCLKNQPDRGSSVIPLEVAPGSYESIAVTADETFTGKGEITLAWTSADGATRRQSSVEVTAPEAGVSSAVIQAGEYQANPFCGVPIRHLFVSKNPSAESLPLRFVTSQPTRVEVYGADESLLSVDAQGNGSLRERGDVLYGPSDLQGNLKLPLHDGSVRFMVLLYPDGPLPKEGLTLNIEVLDNNIWSVFSQDRLLP